MLVLSDQTLDLCGSIGHHLSESLQIHSVMEAVTSRMWIVMLFPFLPLRNVSFELFLEFAFFSSSSKARYGN